MPMCIVRTLRRKIPSYDVVIEIRLSGSTFLVRIHIVFKTTSMGKSAFSESDGNFATVITLKNQPSRGKQPGICGTDFVPYFPKPLRLLFAVVSHHCPPSKKKGTDLFGSVPLTGLTPTAWAVRHALAGRFAHPSVFQRFRTDGVLHLSYGFHVFDVVEVSGSDLLQAFRRPDRRRAGLGE